MKTLWGGILMAVGILIAGASGLCTLTFLLSLTQGQSGGGENYIDAPVILLFGVPPFAIGLTLFLIGRALSRAGKRETLPDA